MDSKNKKQKILLTGGGTGGSVTPLLAVVEEFNHPSPLYKGGKYEFLWLGTKDGPERVMVERAGIKFKTIAGGKWRRYFSLKNLADIFKIKLGFWQALWLMLKWRPNLVMSAGSFISVPVIWAAWLLGVPILIHQQDVRPGLANKLMAPFAKTVTVAFEKSLADYGQKAFWTGNPIRQSMKLAIRDSRFATHFNIQKNLPVVLVVGGGTGAEAINKLVLEGLNDLTQFCQVIHVFGKEKGIRIGIINYFAFEFLDAERMAEALKLADLVVTRAGLGFLTELSYLGKPSIIIPLPDSHQGENAQMFKDAGLVFAQKDLTPEKFTGAIKNLVADKELQKELGEKMGGVMKAGANEAMVKIILELLASNRI